MMNKIDKRLKQILGPIHNCVKFEPCICKNSGTEGIKALFAKEIDLIIGEDEHVGKNVWLRPAQRNELRAELRKRAKERGLLK